MSHKKSKNKRKLNFEKNQNQAKETNDSISEAKEK